MRISNLSSFNKESNYTITAEFNNSGGLKAKAPVVISGVRIGRVTGIGLNPKTFRSVVTMSIESQYNNLPDDTSASIFTAGLLGEQYISLDPGGSDTLLKNNSKIEIVQDAMVLEKLIGDFLFKDKDPEKK
jgi:phospholipid/cholesterol/gamma-HCH transport system substrate-binding protein